VTPFDPILHFLLLALTAIRLCAKFEVYTFNCSRDIIGVPKFQKWVTWPWHDHFNQCCIFSLVLTAVRLFAKLEVCNFSRSRDIKGSLNSKSVSRDRFWPNCEFSL